MRKLWKVAGTRGVDVWWHVHGYDPETGDGATAGSTRYPWVARLWAWWYNLR